MQIYALVWTALTIGHLFGESGLNLAHFSLLTRYIMRGDFPHLTRVLLVSQKGYTLRFGNGSTPIETHGNVAEVSIEACGNVTSKPPSLGWNMPRYLQKFDDSIDFLARRFVACQRTDKDNFSLRNLFSVLLFIEDDSRQRYLDANAESHAFAYAVGLINSHVVNAFGHFVNRIALDAIPELKQVVYSVSLATGFKTGFVTYGDKAPIYPMFYSGFWDGLCQAIKDTLIKSGKYAEHQTCLMLNPLEVVSFLRLLYDNCENQNGFIINAALVESSLECDNAEFEQVFIAFDWLSVKKWKESRTAQQQQ